MTTGDEALVNSPRDILEHLSQVLYSIDLAVHSAQRALVEDPRRLPHLLEFMNQQSGAALNELRRLGDEVT